MAFLEKRGGLVPVYVFIFPDTVAVAMHFAMKNGQIVRCGNSLRFRLRFKKSLAIAVAMPWCT